MVISLDYEAPMARDKSGDSCDDAGSIGTRNGKDVAVYRLHAG